MCVGERERERHSEARLFRRRKSLGTAFGVFGRWDCVSLIDRNGLQDLWAVGLNMRDEHEKVVSGI